MKVEVVKSNLTGEIEVPPSKSVSQRALACALISKGFTQINNFGNSNDELVALEIIQKLGAEVSKNNNSLLIQSEGINPVTNELNFGESGLAARLFIPLIATSKEEFLLNASGSLIKRPFHLYEEILPNLNVSIKTNNGSFPIILKGPLKAKNIKLDGSLSSQFLTGILFTFSYLNAFDKTIIVDNLVSKKYVDLTNTLLKEFHLNYFINEDYKYFRLIKNDNTNKTNIKFNIEGDWSSAAFLLVAGAISGNIILSCLNFNSHQPDREIINILKEVGADIKIENNKIHITKNKLLPFEFDATDTPDLIPPLACLSVFCDGVSKIKGANRLIFKESNRKNAIKEEFTKLNIPIEVENDYLIITGTKKFSKVTLNSHNDHRIAMALTIIGLNSDDSFIIENSDVINKSYIDFFKDLIKLNAKIKFIN